MTGVQTCALPILSALKIADEGIVLNLGNVVAVDSAAKLLSDPAVKAAYLGF